MVFAAAVVWLVTLRAGGLAALTASLPQRNEYNVDLTAGRVRFAKYVFGVKVRSEVEETALSKVYREVLGHPPRPVWRRVSARTDDAHGKVRLSEGPYEHMPGYADDLAFELRKAGLFTREAQREAIVKFFSILSKDAPSQVGPYVEAIERLAADWGPAANGPINAGHIQALGPWEFAQADVPACRAPPDHVAAGSAL